MVDARTITIACAVALTLIGCATTATPSIPKRVVIAGQAKLDLASDTAIFPLDRYLGDPGVDSENARSLATTDCMKAAGHDWQRVPFKPSGSNDWRLFGLWNAPLAAQYGYDVPPNPDLEILMGLNGGEFSDEKEDAFEKCLTATGKKFPRSDSQARNSVQFLGFEAFEQTMSDPAAKKLFTIWEKCMLTHGIAVNVKKLGVLMANVNMKTMPLEQQMQTAVNEVQCKTDNNIVQQLADIDASYQVVLIAKHQAALNKDLALNKKTEAAVAKYLTTHG